MTFSVGSRPRPARVLRIIINLSSLPFPEVEGRPGPDGQWSGPGFHLAVLRESRDFWEDRSTVTVEAAEQELEASRAAPAGILTKR